MYQLHNRVHIQGRHCIGYIIFQRILIVLLVVSELPGRTAPGFQQVRVTGSDIIEVFNARKLLGSDIIHALVAVTGKKERAHQEDANNNESAFHKDRDVSASRRKEDRSGKQTHCRQRKEVDAQKHLTAVRLGQKHRERREREYHIGHVTVALSQAHECTYERETPHQDSHKEAYVADHIMLRVPLRHATGYVLCDGASHIRKVANEGVDITRQVGLRHKVEPARSHQDHHHRQPDRIIAPQYDKDSHRRKSQEWRQRVTEDHKPEDRHQTNLEDHELRFTGRSIWQCIWRS